MKVTYTGKLDPLTRVQQKKLDAQFAKLGKLMDGRGEKESHVILTAQRHLRHAEITVNYMDHTVVGADSGGESIDALLKALDHLEKQILKLKAKHRDTNRKSGSIRKIAPAAKEEAAPEPKAPRIFRVAKRTFAKPMTVEEAILGWKADRNFVAFRDAETERLSVLVRRADGNFDLIES